MEDIKYRKNAERRFENDDDGNWSNVFTKIQDEAEEQLEQFSEELRSHGSAEIKRFNSEFEKHLSPKDGAEMLKHDDEDAKEKTRSCNNCKSIRRVETMYDLKSGQHNCKPGEKTRFCVMNDQVSLYRHYAIVKTVENVEKHLATVTLIHFTEVEGKISVTETKEEFNLQNHEIYIYSYRCPRYSNLEIVQRGESVAKETENSKQFEACWISFCNCEHFASWCVTGNGESMQAQKLREEINSILTTFFGSGSKLARILKFLFMSADEIVIETISVVCPFVTSATCALYLIYCMVMTYYLVWHQYKKKKEICSSCLKSRLIQMWLRFGMFGMTSAITYLIPCSALALICPVVGVPLLTLFLLLSTVLHLAVPKIHRMFASPLQCVERRIEKLSELNPGDVISFRYYMFHHNLVVTEVTPSENIPTQGKITCIHFNFSGPFSKRVVIEEMFDKDVTKSVVKRLDFGSLETFSSAEVVCRAVKRIGETKWDSTSN